jgi:ActR/RegA family two-component response regulator
MRLLLADGDLERLELGRRFFTNCGHAVETAAGAVECLAKIRAFEPDVLLLDWELPWGGGAGVLACLRDDAALPMTPVVLTGCEALGHGSLAPPVVKQHHTPMRFSQLLNSLQIAAITGARRSQREVHPAG